MLKITKGMCALVAATGLTVGACGGSSMGPTPIAIAPPVATMQVGQSGTPFTMNGTERPTILVRLSDGSSAQDYVTWSVNDMSITVTALRPTADGNPVKISALSSNDATATLTIVP